MRQFLETIQDNSLRQKVLEMHDKLEPEMRDCPASVNKHHSFKGGYYRHVEEVIRGGIALFNVYTKTGCSMPLLDDIILVAFVHDLDKLIRYKRNDGTYVVINPDVSLRCGKTKWVEPEFMYDPDFLSFESSGYIAMRCCEFNIQLTKEHLHAITFHHGGWSDMAHRVKSITPLACIIHSSDLMSAFVLGG